MKLRGSTLSAWLLFLGIWLCSCESAKHQHPDKFIFRYNDASGVLTLDPAFAKDQSHTWVCQQLYSGLVELDSALKVQPSISSSWVVSDSGKTYTFTLRNDVYFNENKLFKSLKVNQIKTPLFTRKVTAADFVFSLNRLTDRSVASPGAWVMGAVVKDSVGYLIGIKAINDTTLEIRLDHPFPAFLSLLAMPYCAVVPEEVVRHYGTDFRSHPCGTGPFHLAYWKEGVQLILQRNELFYQLSEGTKLPFLDAVDISFITDKQSAFIEFLKGNLDILSGLDASYKDELLTTSGELQPRHRGQFRLETLPYLNTEYLGILVDSSLEISRKSPLHDRRIRQALSLGFDREAMMRYLRNNMGTPGLYGFVPPGLPTFSAEPSMGYSYEPEHARTLMREAGYPDGKGLPEIVLGTTSSYLDLCEFIKSQWEELGFTIKIDVNQAAVHRKMVAEQKITFFRGSWIADYPDAENYLSLFYSQNAAPVGPNYTHYANETFDRLYRQSMSAATEHERDSCYRSMDRLMMQDAPVIILYYDKVVRLTQLGISGLPANAMNNLNLKYVRKSIGG